MNDMEITDGVAGEETKGAEGQEGQQAEAEGAKDTGLGEDAQVSVGMATIPMRVWQEMAENLKPLKSALSAEEKAKQLLAAYAEYQQSHIFTAGQLVIPKRLGAEKSDGIFGVILDPNAVPGPRDASWETLRIGYLRDGTLQSMCFDPLRFQPYVPSVEDTGADAPGTALAGEETGTPQ